MNKKYHENLWKWKKKEKKEKENQNEVTNTEKKTELKCNG